MKNNYSVTIHDIMFILQSIQNLDERSMITIATDIERTFRQCTAPVRPGLRLVKGGKAVK